MANTTIDQLSSLTGTGVATGDLFLVYDASANIEKNISSDEMKNMITNAPFTITTSGVTDAFVVTSTDAGATAAPDIVFYRNSASPSAGDGIGNIIFRGKNSAAADSPYAGISANIVNPTNAAESANISLHTMSDGTLTEGMRIGASGIVTIPGLTTETKSLEIGTGRTGSGISHIDLVGDTTYGDYGLRIIRNAGATATTQIQHRGTGSLRLETAEAAPMLFLTTNTERMRIDASGNVGLGISPVVKLDVRGDGLIARLSSATSGDAYMRFDGNGTVTPFIGLLGGVGTFGTVDASPLTFRTALSERMRIDASGNVGIGTINPLANFHVNAATTAASMRLSVADVTYGNLFASNSSTALYSVTALPLVFGTTNTERMRIDADGNVGIGTVAPSRPLHVVTAGTTISAALLQNDTGDTAVFTRSQDTGTNTLYFGDTTNFQSGFLQYAHTSDLMTSRSAGAISLQTGGANERMRIDASGNVGIGANSIDPIFGRTLQVGNGSTAASISILGTGAETTGDIFLTSSSSTASIMARASTSLIFGTNDTERLRIDAAGNLGFGVTPSAWGVGAKGIEFGAGNAILSGTTGYSAIYLANNTYFDGTTWVYKNTQTANLYAQNFGNHQWFMAPSGTAGDPITFTQAMTLDTSGNLSVGSVTGNRAGVDRAISVEGATTSILESNINGSRAGYLYSDAATTVVGEFRNGPLSFRTSDTERLRISETGSVLIPAISTESKVLDIGAGRTGDGTSAIDLIGDATYTEFGARLLRNAGENASTQMQHRGTGGLRLETIDAAPMLFLTTNAERMRIDPTGNVGIGLVNPSQKLEVLGNIFINNVDGEGLIMNGGAGILRGSANSMVIQTNSAECIRIDSAGNIGIGNLTPTAKLHVTGQIAGGYTTHATGATAMALGINTAVKVTPNATATYTTTVAPAGSRASIIILTAGVTSWTITFGTGFKTTGVLATGVTAARFFVIEFISDGISMIETSRTVAMA